MDTLKDILNQFEGDIRKLVREKDLEIKRLKGLVWKAWTQGEDNIICELEVDITDYAPSERPTYKTKEDFKKENNLA